MNTVSSTTAMSHAKMPTSHKAMASAPRFSSGGVDPGTLAPVAASATVLVGSVLYLLAKLFDDQDNNKPGTDFLFVRNQDPKSRKR